MFTTIFTIDLNSFWVYGVLGGGVGGAEPVTTDSRRIHDWSRLTRADALVCLQLNDVRIFRQSWNLQDMFTTIFTFDLNSFWVYGVLGGGVGGAEPVTTDSRRTRADALKYILNDVRIFRQLWNLQDMFTTIFTFDLNSFWVYGVLGGGVGGAEPVTTDSRRTRADALKYILNDVRIFRQLWNLQDMFTTIFTFDLNSFWVYGVLGVGWGCQHRPDGPTTDPTGKFLSPQTWL